MGFEKVPARNAVDYVLRTTQQHHVQLSAMADQKANIIVAFSSVVFTVSLTQIGAMRFVYGFVALALSSSVALIMAVMSLIPRFERARSRRVDIPLNPLFFGHFTELSEHEYMEEMSAILADDVATYEAIVRDIYQIGQVLRRKKYFYLGLSYRVFLWGIVAAVSVFLGEFLFSI